ncbi:MAG: Rpn family recombination-promoting nuclease/putative transposase [Scytonematopsis contorta HA4267-MV1]|jgi:predicted transposase YdaD|nr:Rpn family recombination-promoting nuclease/putative transposase [Scytonematopsis contorta HA4267-MV1]
MSFDNTCKYLAEEYPKDFVRWLLGVETQDITVLKTELFLEPIRADSVILLQLTNRILHLEFQTDPISKPPIPFRMGDYSFRLKRKYGCPVTQVVIFLQETTNEAAFIEEYRDETTIHRYHVIRMWEQDPALFLDNPGLLPLAPLTKTDSPRALLAQVAERVAKISDIAEQQSIAGCLGILAGLRFDKDLIHQFLREDIMRESVIYQDIWERSRKEEAATFCLKLINQRFGDIDASIIQQIKILTVEQIETLGGALFNISEIGDLVAYLKQQQQE